MQNIQFASGVVSAGDCVSDGWNLVKNNYGTYLGIGLVAMIIAGCIPCVSLFLAGPIMCGVYYVYLRDISNEPTDFGMMFKGFDKFLPAMLLGLIAAIPEIVGQIIRVGINFADFGLKNTDNPSDAVKAMSVGLIIVLAILALIIFVLSIALKISMFFVFPLIAEHELNAIDAIKVSASAAWANLGGLIVLFILEFLIVIGGMLLCVVGLFLLSMPLIYAANAYAYRRVFPKMRDDFRQTPPNPNEYGGKFGVGM